MFFFLLALVAYILWWLRSNLFELASATRIFLLLSVFNARPLKSCCVIMFILRCGHFGGKKNEGCAGLFWTAFRRGRIFPGSLFCDGFVLFPYLCFLAPSLILSHRSLAVLDIRRPHLGLFAVVKTLCFLQHISGITQPAFSGKIFSPPLLICFKLRLILF